MSKISDGNFDWWMMLFGLFFSVLATYFIHVFATMSLSAAYGWTTTIEYLFSIFMGIIILTIWIVLSKKGSSFDETALFEEGTFRKKSAWKDYEKRISEDTKKQYDMMKHKLQDPNISFSQKKTILSLLSDIVDDFPSGIRESFSSEFCNVRKSLIKEANDFLSSFENNYVAESSLEGKRKLLSKLSEISFLLSKEDQLKATSIYSDYKKKLFDNQKNENGTS